MRIYPTLQGSILGSRGNSRLKRANHRPESTVGEKRLIFIVFFWGGHIRPGGPSMTNFTPVTRALAAPLWEWCLKGTCPFLLRATECRVMQPPPPPLAPSQIFTLIIRCSLLTIVYVSVNKSSRFFSLLNLLLNLLWRKYILYYPTCLWLYDSCPDGEMVCAGVSSF